MVGDDTVIEFDKISLTLSAITFDLVLNILDLSVQKERMTVHVMLRVKYEYNSQSYG